MCTVGRNTQGVKIGRITSVTSMDHAAGERNWFTTLILCSIRLYARNGHEGRRRRAATVLTFGTPWT